MFPVWGPEWPGGWEYDCERPRMLCLRGTLGTVEAIKSCK